MIFYKLNVVDELETDFSQFDEIKSVIKHKDRKSMMSDKGFQFGDHKHDINSSIAENSDEDREDSEPDASIKVNQWPQTARPGSVSMNFD